MTETPPADKSVPDAPRGSLSLQTIAMPADTNPHGDIFGGWLMSQMDLAARPAARKPCARTDDNLHDGGFARRYRAVAPTLPLINRHVWVRSRAVRPPSGA